MYTITSHAMDRIAERTQMDPKAYWIAQDGKRRAKVLDKLAKTEQEVTDQDLENAKALADAFLAEHPDAADIRYIEVNLVEPKSKQVIASAVMRDSV